MAKILLIHGPNLNLLGQREPEIYGLTTLADYEILVARVAEKFALEVETWQSNHEGEIVERIHGARGTVDGIIINAGALTHYAWSIHDALATFSGPIIEVHISNPNSREPWRHTSVISPVATGMIAGMGQLGYELAVEAVASQLSR